MAPAWAKISDRIGRKPTLMIGSYGAMVSAVMLGFSWSLWWAVGVRLLAGMCNPNMGVVATYVGEILSKDQQGELFGLSFCVRIGLMGK